MVEGMSVNKVHHMHGEKHHKDTHTFVKLMLVEIEDMRDNVTSSALNRGLLLPL